MFSINTIYMYFHCIFIVQSVSARSHFICHLCSYRLSPCLRRQGFESQSRQTYSIKTQLQLHCLEKYTYSGEQSICCQDGEKPKAEGNFSTTEGQLIDCSPRRHCSSGQFSKPLNINFSIIIFEIYLIISPFFIETLKVIICIFYLSY